MLGHWQINETSPLPSPLLPPMLFYVRSFPGRVFAEVTRKLSYRPKTLPVNNNNTRSMVDFGNVGLLSQLDIEQYIDIEQKGTFYNENASVLLWLAPGPILEEWIFSIFFFWGSQAVILLMAWRINIDFVTNWKTSLFCLWKLLCLWQYERTMERSWICWTLCVHLQPVSANTMFWLLSFITGSNHIDFRQPFL